MNKELEEAIKKLNNFILETNKIKDTSEEWHGYMNDELHELKRTVEIVLQAVENSIPTSVVEEKIKDIDRALDEEYEKSVAYMQLMCAKNQIKELLGE